MIRRRDKKIVWVYDDDLYSLKLKTVMEKQRSIADTINDLLQDIEVEHRGKKKKSPPGNFW